MYVCMHAASSPQDAPVSASAMLGERSLHRFGQNARLVGRAVAEPDPSAWFAEIQPRRSLPLSGQGSTAALQKSASGSESNPDRPRGKRVAFLFFLFIYARSACARIAEFSCARARRGVFSLGCESLAFADPTFCRLHASQCKSAARARRGGQDQHTFVAGGILAGAMNRHDFS